MILLILKSNFMTFQKLESADAKELHLKEWEILKNEQLLCSIDGMMYFEGWLLFGSDFFPGNFISFWWLQLD